MPISLLLAFILLVQAPASDPPSDPTAQPQQAKHARVSGAVMDKQCIHKVQPVSPATGAQHMIGAIVLRILIGKDGKVEEATAMSGPEIFRQPAVDAVRKWQYKPYLLNGEPTEVETTATMPFR